MELQSKEILPQLPVNRQHLESTLNALPLQAYDHSTTNPLQLGAGLPLQIIEESIISQMNKSGMSAAEINKHIIFSLDAVMNTGKGRGTVQEVALADLPVLAGLALDEFRGQSQMDSVIVRTVFGGSKEYPLRSLSYLVPSLTYAQELKNNGLQVPHVQFISMPHVAGAVNGGEAYRMKTQSALLSEVGRGFVESFFPEIADKVQFVDDERFIKSPVVQELHLLLQRHSADIFNEEMQQQFSRMDKSTFDYAAYHPLVHDWYYMEQLFYEPVDPTVIINVGGKAEKQFDMFRRRSQIVLERAAYYCDVALPKTVQMFSDHKVPPYIPLNGFGSENDISLEQAKANPSLVYERYPEVNRKNKEKQNLLCRDVETITGATGSIDRFVEFLAECRN
jgi:hypothetical protein